MARQLVFRFAPDHSHSSKYNLSSLQVCWTGRLVVNCDESLRSTFLSYLVECCPLFDAIGIAPRKNTPGVMAINRESKEGVLIVFDRSQQKRLLN